MASRFAPFRDHELVLIRCALSALDTAASGKGMALLTFLCITLRAEVTLELEQRGVQKPYDREALELAAQKEAGRAAASREELNRQESQLVDV